MKESTWIVKLSDGRIWLYRGTEIAADAFGQQMAWGDLQYTVEEVPYGPIRIPS